MQGFIKMHKTVLQIIELIIEIQNQCHLSQISRFKNTDGI